MQVGYDSRDGFNYYRLPGNYDRNHTNAGFRGRLVLRANRLSGIERMFVRETMLPDICSLMRCVFSHDAGVMHRTRHATEISVICTNVRLSAGLSQS